MGGVVSGHHKRKRRQNHVVPEALTQRCPMRCGPQICGPRAFRIPIWNRPCRVTWTRSLTICLPQIIWTVTWVPITPTTFLNRCPTRSVTAGIVGPSKMVHDGGLPVFYFDLTNHVRNGTTSVSMNTICAIGSGCTWPPFDVAWTIVRGVGSTSFGPGNQPGCMHPGPLHPRRGRPHQPFCTSHRGC